MLIGRERELAQLTQLLYGLQRGDGHTLAIQGDPGMGKSVLLDALCDRAGPDVTVVRARGVESEAEIAFSALADICGPLLDGLDSLPSPQRSALAAAIALAPPRPGGRLAVCVASLGLLRVAARLRPILVVVDDLHWLDAPSRECVLFAARRTGGRVAMALGERRARHESSDDGDHFEELRLEPLADEESRAVLSTVAPDLAPDAADAVVAAAAGNPLALVELTAGLSDEQRSGRRPLAEPLIPGRRLRAIFGERVARLTRDARGALLVAAAYEGDELRVIAPACEGAGYPVHALTSIEEERGLIRVHEGRLAFAHPLVRGAAYYGARPVERRAAHLALAGALQGEQAAWHLAAAAAGTDEEVAQALEDAAGRAAERRGFASAARAWERAARLSERTEDAARRLLEACECARAAGLPTRAETLATEAATAAGDGPLRARAHHLLGLGMLWTDRADHGVALLVEEADLVAIADPGRAAAMLADASVGSFALGDCRRAQDLAERAVKALGAIDDSDLQAHVLGALASVLAMRGRNRPARAALERLERLAGAADPLSSAGRARARALASRIACGEIERARRDARAMRDQVHDAGALDALYNPLVNLADASLLLGDWRAASVAASEAIALGHDIGLRRPRPFATLGRVLAAQGAEDEARQAIDSGLEIATGRELRGALPLLYAAVGFLELSHDRTDPAIRSLQSAHDLSGASGLSDPTFVPYGPDLVEALVRDGRRDEALRICESVASQASATPTPLARGAVARCQGLLADDFDRLFGQALSHHERAGTPFEHARTLLAYGQRLHRAKRRAEARERLRAAHATFEALGAGPWVVRTNDELRSAGARRRGPMHVGLTPQEARVASAVARGASNREVAAELYLSPRTVEFHLVRVYRKLGVRSRTQLVAALATGGGDPGAPADETV